MSGHNGSLTVEGIARLSSIPAHTIRYYTRRGLLNPGRNSANSYRLYSEADLLRLRLIRKSKSLGLSLGEIRKVLDAAEHGASPCAMVRNIITRRIVENRRRLGELAMLQSRMEHAVEVWSQLPKDVVDRWTVCDLIEAASA
jgi:MerR family transcriptional regulator, Zn(II)-responsive regulator of zntA